MILFDSKKMREREEEGEEEREGGRERESNFETRQSVAKV